MSDYGNYSEDASIPKTKTFTGQIYTVLHLQN